MRNLLRSWLGVSDAAAPGAKCAASLGDVARTIDLRNTPVLFALLDDTHAWRERLVEELLIEDGDHISVTSSYQIRIQPEMLAGAGVEVESGSQVRLLLPLTTKPKELLLGVDLTGPDGWPAALLLKSQIGELQRRYLLWMSPRQIDPGLSSFLYGIFTFSGGTWAHIRESSQGDREEAVARYLSDGTQLRIDRAQVLRWQADLARVQHGLIAALNEPVPDESLLRSLLLAIPFAEQRPKSVADIDAWIHELNDYVAASPRVVQALLAEYCVRWEFIVDVVVAVGEPCKIKLATRRPWGSDDPRSTTQRVATGDAATVHIDIRVGDHSVLLAKSPELRDLNGNRVGLPVVDEMRFSHDVASIYVSNDQDRPYFVDLSLELALRRSTRLMTTMLWVLVVAAVVGALILPEDTGLADGLALLVFPLTLAGSVVLTRETTGVAQRLHERNRHRLTAAIGLVWILSTLRVIAVDVDLEWLGDTWTELRHYVSA